jgi:hypothetical protein
MPTTHFHRNFEMAILKAYRWLADNYRPHDRIYVFGNTSTENVLNFIDILLSLRFLARSVSG